MPCPEASSRLPIPVSDPVRLRPPAKSQWHHPNECLVQGRPNTQQTLARWILVQPHKGINQEDVKKLCSDSATVAHLKERNPCSVRVSVARPEGLEPPTADPLSGVSRIEV
jgi:hypothetical protein